MAARGINFDSLRPQGMALRDEIRSIPCWKTRAEVEALEEREGWWQDHVEKLEKADPDIRNSGGGWRAHRLATIWNEIVQALSDLRARPCASGGMSPRAARNLPISNDDDWGDSGHSTVMHRSTDPYPHRGGSDDAPYNWPGGKYPGSGKGDLPGPGSGVYPFPGGGDYPGSGGAIPGH